MLPRNMLRWCKRGLSDILAARRISVFGHIAPLGNDVPAHMALRNHVDLSVGRPPGRDWKRHHGRHCARWIDQVRQDSPATWSVKYQELRRIDNACSRHYHHRHHHHAWSRSRRGPLAMSTSYSMPPKFHWWNVRVLPNLIDTMMSFPIATRRTTDR